MKTLLFHLNKNAKGYLFLVLIMALVPYEGLAAAYKVTGITIGSQSTTLTYGTGSSTTYTLTLSESGNGSPAGATSILSINWTAPTGATVSGLGTINLTGNNQTITLTITTTGATPAGTTSFTISSTNNVVTSSSANFVVGKKNLSITANNGNKIYGSTQTTPVSGSTAFISSGLAGSETIGSVTLNYSATALPATANAGSTSTITPSAATGGTFLASNYNISYNTGTLTVNTANLTVTAGTQSKTYGATAPTSGTLNTNFTVSGLQNSDTANGATLGYSGSPAGNLATANIGSYTITPSSLTLSSGLLSNYNITYNTGTLTVNTANVTILSPAVTTKTYDGTNTAAITGTLSGIANGDSVTLNGSGTFNDKNAGTNKLVTPTCTLVGIGSSNYSLTQPAGLTGTITARTLTITGVTNNKTYNGTTSSIATPTITSGTIQAGDTAAFVQMYDDKNVGTNKTLTPLGIVNDGNNGNNYTYTFIPDNSGSIDASNLTINGVADSKMYDGDANSTTIPTIVGTIYSGDIAAFTQTYNNKNTGNNKPMIPSGLVIDGNNGNNYNYTFISTNNGTITARSLTITGSASTKIYDASTNCATVPSVTFGTIQLGDNAAFIQTYDNKNIGTNKIMTPSGIVNDGNSGNNYTYTFITDNNGTVTARSLTITGMSDSKIYDGTTNSNATPAITSGTIQSGDVAAFTQSFDNKNAGTDKAITPSGIVNDGNNGNNYSYTFIPTNNGIVNAKAVSVLNPAVVTKIYDATANAIITGTLSGVENGDDVTLIGTGNFDTKNAGSEKSVSSTSTLSGADSSNYSVTQPTNLTGTITVRSLTVTGGSNTKIYDGTTNSNATPAITSGTIQSGDIAAFTQSFDNKNIGTNKTLTPSGIVNDGNNGNNYSYTFIPTITGTISAKAVSISNPTVVTKIYDATANAVITGTLSGVENGDDVTLFGTGNFDTKNAGSDKSVSSTSTLNGADSSNYTLTQPSNLTGTITPRAVTVTGVSNTKIYDGTTNSNATPAITSGIIQSGDIAVFTQSFDNKNAGTDKAITPSGIVNDGNNGNNYSYTYIPTNNGTINPKSLIVTALDISKCFGNTYTPDSANFSSNGLISGEIINSVNLNSVGTLSSTPPGTYPISISQASGANFNPSDYSILYNGGTLTVNALPNDPIGSNGSICGGGNVIISATVGTNETVNWYDASSGGTLLSDSVTIYTTPAITATTIYYAEAINTLTGCVSNLRTPVIATVSQLSNLGKIGCIPGPICSGSSKKLGLYEEHIVGNIQWQSSNDNVNFTNIDGANSFYYMTEATTTTYYRAVAQNEVCPQVATPSVKVVVVPSVDNAVILGGDTIKCSNETIQLTANSGTGLTYKWLSCRSKFGIYSTVEGANTSTLNVSNPYLTYYKVIISNGSCNAISDPIEVQINKAPVIRKIYGGATICYNTISNLKINDTQANIQWESSSDNINYTDINGAITTTYTTNNLINTTYYRVKLSNGVCPAIYTDSFKVTVIQPAVSGVISGGEITVCPNVNSTKLTLNGHNGNIKWQYSNDNINFVNFQYATNETTFTATNLKATTYYRVTANNGKGCVPAISPSVAIYVNSFNTGNVNGTTSVCNGDNAELNMSDYSNGASFQWQKSINLTGPYSNISGATNNSYTTPPLTNTTYYRTQVTYNGCIQRSLGFGVTVNNCGKTPVNEANNTEISDVSFDFDVVYYPNPFTNYFKIKLTTDNEENLSIAIYDMLGKLIENHLVYPREFSNLQLGENYPSGIYNVIVTQKQNNKTIKVIKL